VIALFALEREIRMAGFGLNSSRAFNCNCDPVTNPGCSSIRYYYSGVYSFPPHASLIGARNALSLYPVVITDTPNAADTISVFYGSNNERVLGTQLQEAMGTAADDLKPDGVSGFTTGNLVVLANANLCAMMQVTSVVTGTSKLGHASNSWNPAGGGTLPVFPAGTLVFNLGTNPAWRAFGINNGRLQLTDQFQVLTAGAVSQDIMDDIVDLQAQYGKDTTNDGIVDVWDKVTPTDSTLWTQVIAVRLAVLARSDEYVRPSAAGGACEATTTTNRPTWSGGAFPTFDAAGALPSCYKYRVFETVVPLRNMIWRPE
jgi:type IV pilus assembly protein PilW